MSSFTYADGYEIYEDYKDCEAVEIVNKRIYDMSDQVVIAGEINSQYIQFMVGRYDNGIDLSDKSFHIHYAYGYGKGSESVPVNMMCNDKYLKFGWIVPPQATLKAGKVAIMIWCSGVNSKDKDFLWKTKTRTFAVQEGAIIGSGIAEPDEEWYLDFVRKMNDLIEDAKADIKKATTDANKAAEGADESAKNADRATEGCNQATEDIRQVKTEALEAIDTCSKTTQNCIDTTEEAKKAIVDITQTKEDAEAVIKTCTGVTDTARQIIVTAEQVIEVAMTEIVSTEKATLDSVSATGEARTATGECKTATQNAIEAMADTKEAATETVAITKKAESTVANIDQKLANGDLTGPPGPQGNPGEVTTVQLNEALAMKADLALLEGLTIKHESTGSEICVEDSADYRILSFELYGTSIQNGTPTPDTPIAIQSVGDSGSIDIVSSIGRANLMAHNTAPTIEKPVASDTTITAYTHDGIQGYLVEKNTLSESWASYVRWSITNNHVENLDAPYSFSVYVANLSENNTGVGSFFANNTSTNVFLSSTSVEVKSGFAGRIKFENKIVNSSYKKSNNDTTWHFTLPTTYTTKLFIAQPKLEIGTFCTDFTPRLKALTTANEELYKDLIRKVSIPISNPLRAINSICDKICYQDGGWGIKRYIARVDNSKWVLREIAAGTTGYRFSCTTSDAQKTKNIPVICSSFEFKVKDSYSHAGNYVATDEILTYGRISIRVDADFNANTTDAFRIWAEENEMKTLYILAAPIFEPFDDNTQSLLNSLSTLNGTTYIYTTDTLEPEMYIKYVCDPNIIESNMSTRFQTLENAILELGGVM